MYNILVVGWDHHNTLGVIESLGEKGVFPYVILYTKSADASILHSKYIKKGWLCNSPENVVKCMIENFRGFYEKTIVLTTADNVAVAIDEHYETLADQYILPAIRETGTLREKMDKEFMSRLAREVNLSVPETWIVSDGKIPSDIVFPCITKAISSVVGGKSNICICRSRADLEQFFLDKRHCTQVQIQRYIDKEYEFQLIGCSLNGGAEIVIPGRTHIKRPKGLDNTFFLSFDKIEKDYEELLVNVKKFIRKVGYSGTFSVEFLKDKNDGKAYFTEMNFRNDGNAYSVTAAGINLPYIWYLYNSGQDYRQEIDNVDIKKSFFFPELTYTKCMLTGEVGLMEYIKNWRKATCFAMYHKRDKGPFKAFIKDMVMFAINKVLHR